MSELVKPDFNLNDPRYQPNPYVELKSPVWSCKASIYEVNIRQYTPEGTFKAFEEHLPRLKKLGVDILWLMPVHPIGVKNRKGTLGSYYAVKDYYSINPEFGTKDDFTHLVKKIHEMGMYVIIDWVANHSAADNPLVSEHPSWYTQSSDGIPQPTPWFDWDDILDFNYNQPALRKYMTEAMKYWVLKFDIDGFRADVAGFVPNEFWENLREELEAVKPVFMLAEWESRDLHKKAFDMTYAWSLYYALRDATSGGKGLHSLYEYIAHDVNTFPREAFRMTFTENHDKNSWEGTTQSNFGDGYHAAAALCFTMNGMPLIYSGQEAGLDRSLPFFEKDAIEWKEHPDFEFYQKLLTLKKLNKALWNGVFGGVMEQIKNTNPSKVISFGRHSEGDRIVVMVNLSSEETTPEFENLVFSGEYRDVFTDKRLVLNTTWKQNLPPWGFLILHHEATTNL